MPQGLADKIQLGGMVLDRYGKGHFLQCLTPPADAVFAKAVLASLFEAVNCSWDIDVQDATLTIWCEYHPLYAYRMDVRDVGKGMSKVKRVARELVARCREGGTC
jgi:hypothetical protein